MKYIKFAIPVASLMVLWFFARAGHAETRDESTLKTVSTVDLNRYQGKWYEIAKYPNKFQKQCVGNTTAEYTQKPGGKIEVLNKCVTSQGQIDEAKGEAKIVDKTSNAKLKVRFAPGFLSFIPSVWGDYWIIDLDPEYRWAVIGEPGREYFWILAREPQMDDATYQGILRRAEAKGFDPAKVEKTPQNVVVLKGAVIERS
jgi:apolipoprotein D and lipocalin family protein